jgi:hypothetical protein
MPEKYEPVVGYCEYLDKEMTIMGLLSAFAVAGSALVLERTAGAKSGEQEWLSTLWTEQQDLVIAGSIALLLAGFAFYLQRSWLANLYGQLRLSLTIAPPTDLSTKELLDAADSWDTWRRYRFAFVCLSAGFAFYGIALFLFQHDYTLPGRLERMTIAGVLAVAGALFVADESVRRTYEDSNDPWECFRQSVWPTAETADVDTTRTGNGD